MPKRPSEAEQACEQRHFAWKKRYQVRAGVEGTLSQAVRAFGMRRSRYIGLAKTGQQQVCTAAAMNAVRVVRWLDGLQRPRRASPASPPSLKPPEFADSISATSPPAKTGCT